MTASSYSQEVSVRSGDPRWTEAQGRPHGIPAALLCPGTGQAPTQGRCPECGAAVTPKKSGFIARHKLPPRMQGS